jgi:lipoyl-dependent peroxiredoxin
LPVTWKDRAEDPRGNTSPEELLAAAHAACFSMALSGALARAGHEPVALSTTATVTFVPGTGITKSVLDVQGTVPGMDEPEFRQAAEGAKENCPVSQALKGNVELALTARLTD